MENTGFKGLLVSLYQRVILSHKTTLLGILVVGGGVIVDYYVASPNKVISAVAGLVGGVLLFIKERYPAPTQPTIP